MALQRVLDAPVVVVIELAEDDGLTVSISEQPIGTAEFALSNA